jgi:hypothetical protein
MIVSYYLELFESECNVLTREDLLFGFTWAILHPSFLGALLDVTCPLPEKFNLYGRVFLW